MTQNSVKTGIGATIAGSEADTDSTLLEQPTGPALAAAMAGGSAGGLPTQIQFNDAGFLAGNAALAFDKATNQLTHSDGLFVQNFPPLLPNNGNSKVFYEVVTSAGLNGAGGSDANAYRFVITTGQVSNGPPGQLTYYNNVFGFGWNITQSFTQLDPTKPASSYRIETKYSQGGPNGVFSSEFHVATQMTLQGNERRMIEALAPHSETDAATSSVGFAANYQYQSDYLGNPQIIWDFNGKQVTVNRGIRFYFAANNVPVLSQINAAGTSSIALPYIDDFGNTVISGALTGAGSGGNAPGVQAMTHGSNSNVFTGTAPGAASAAMSISCGTGAALKSASFANDATGNLVIAQASAGGAIYFDHNADAIWRNRSAGYAIAMHLNSGSLGVGAGYPARKLHVTGTDISAGGIATLARLTNALAALTPVAGIGVGMEFEAAVQSGGVKKITASIETPTTSIAVGAEAADLVFKTMSAGAVPAERLRLNSIAMTARQPVVTVGYTVATLPTASAVLKGARAHITDATAPAWLMPLTGGGTVTCPVFCNGSAWVAG